MKFSVLVANYNNGKFFRDCYQSIVSQSYDNWEAIILDDKSTDNSLQIIRELIGDDSRFRIYENAENAGVGVIKSKLIELATGDICGFVDPDDAILPTAIEKSVEIFSKDKKTVLTYSRFMKCDKNLQPVAPFQSAKQVANNNPYFFNCPIVINHFVCFRRDIYLQTEKINQELRISEDQDLYLKMYEKGNVKFISDTNYLYRTHAGGISQNDNKKKSYELWGMVIWNAMQRRGLKTIHGKKIPGTYTNAQEIFDLLKYQNSFFYRIRKRILVAFFN
ncbi:MAG: glycosyltransferase [Flavobacteriia bacterium]|nr:glycosyltransferase [Flavobacteriia bacterium]MBH2023632.1 glycosyltransferase [Flavobacteriales bacterium]